MPTVSYVDLISKTAKILPLEAQKEALDYLEFLKMRYVQQGEGELAGESTRYAEVAERLRQSPSTIRRWSKVGILPALKVGRKILFSPEEIKGWVKNKKLFDSPQERLRQLTRWSHGHAKKHGFDKLSEEDISRIMHENRKCHQKAESSGGDERLC